MSKNCRNKKTDENFCDSALYAISCFGLVVRRPDEDDVVAFVNDNVWTTAG